jgi:hypothetical protein
MLICNTQLIIKYFKVHRHGDRSPNNIYPTNANKNFWNQYGGLGQLTQTGLLNNYFLFIHFKIYI